MIMTITTSMMMIIITTTTTIIIIIIIIIIIKKGSGKFITGISGKSTSRIYSRLSLNRNLYKTDTSVKRTPRVGPCLSLLPLIDSL